MKRLCLTITAVIILSAAPGFARDHGQGGDGGWNSDENRQEQQQGENRQGGGGQAPVQRGGGREMSRQPGGAVIDVNRSSSGWHNRNFPAEKQPQSAEKSGDQGQEEPSYGRIKWKNKAANGQGNQRVIKQQGESAVVVEPVQGEKQAVNYDTAKAAHHRPYQPDVLRERLKKIGVVSEPSLITRREEVMHTDREHSRIELPRTGFDNKPLRAEAFSSRRFNDKAVKSQMSLVTSADWRGRIRDFDRRETTVNHYYWHNDRGFTYCHYIDGSGYHWYGWYIGPRYFWVRYFNDRWWWYDDGFDRWCFWNDGFWWWQDPFHFGDLYVYNDTEYIPCNTVSDLVAVAVPTNTNVREYASPDGKRMVKVVSDTQDAFLYDTSGNQEFRPVYLASGVKDVMYSDTSGGKPLQIILKLNDGTYDMFDEDGKSYNTVINDEAPDTGQQ